MTETTRMEVAMMVAYPRHIDFEIGENAEYVQHLLTLSNDELKCMYTMVRAKYPSSLRKHKAYC